MSEHGKDSGRIEAFEYAEACVFPANTVADLGQLIPGPRQLGRITWQDNRLDLRRWLACHTHIHQTDQGSGDFEKRIEEQIWFWLAHKSACVFSIGLESSNQGRNGASWPHTNRYHYTKFRVRPSQQPRDPTPS